VAVTQAFGTNYKRLTGGAAAVVKDRGGIVGKVIVTAAITGSITVYDDPAAATGGSEVFVSPATPAVGTVFELGLRCKSGIYVAPGSAGTIIVSFE
jgi:hypothetical protein